MSIDDLIDDFTDYCRLLERHAASQCAHAVREAHQQTYDEGVASGRHVVLSGSFGDHQAAAAIEYWSKRVTTDFFGRCPTADQLPNQADRKRALDLLIRQLQSLAGTVERIRRDTVRALIAGDERPISSYGDERPEGPTAADAAVTAQMDALREGRMLLQL